MSSATLVAFRTELCKLGALPSGSLGGVLKPRNPLGSMAAGKFKSLTGPMAGPPPTPRALAPGPATSQVASTPGSMPASTIPSPLPTRA